MTMGGEQVEHGHAVVLTLAAVREGDTLVVPKLDRLARCSSQMPAPGRNCAASCPNCPSGSSGNSAVCMSRARLLSATSPSSSQSRDQPSTEHSTDAIPLSVRSCPLPESTRHTATPGRNGNTRHSQACLGGFAG